MNRPRFHIACLMLAAVVHAFPPATAAWAEDIEDVYLAPEAFLAQAFDGAVPPAAKLWLTKSIKPGVTEILGHEPGMLRVTYWRRDARTAWILDEIGKVKPITTGIVIDGDAIRRVQVLIYRESRGWEVRHDFFTNQFKGARLDAEGALDRPIDGISGATLSVSALTRLARVALFLNRALKAAGT